MAKPKKTKSTNSKKQNRKPTNMRERILEFMRAPDYTPTRLVDLQKQISQTPAENKQVQKHLDRLQSEGVVVKLKKKGLTLAESADLLAGIISFTRGGSAFVDVTSPRRSVFVAPEDTGTALHGDKVLVRIKRAASRKGGRNLAEARVIRILERSRRVIVGILKKTRRFYYVEPMQAQLPKDVIVPRPEGASLNDRVLVELEDWQDPQLNPEGQIKEVIGPADDPNLDTLSVIKAYELPEHFPPETVNEAQQAILTEQAYANRQDFRQKFVFTIDPETARDFDDATSLEKTRKGNWNIGVHIADVSYFVKPDSALDSEAFKRGTSVYLPDQVIPMLPEQLSNGLCSLKEDADRLAFSAIITLDDDANVIRARFTPSVIRSNKRLTYEQALNILELPEGEAHPDNTISQKLVDKVRQAHQLAQKLRHRRTRRGALMMELPEVKFKIGNDGRIEDVHPVKNDISHQLIEELMLLANEQVCRYLSKHGIMQLHRIHAEPDEESLAEIQDMLKRGGIHAGNLNNQTNLAEALQQIRDMPAAHAWYTNILRCLKRAEYSIEAVGHYGLAKEYYAHFTSPIRRYPDLVTHRLLKTVLAGEKNQYSKNRLDEIAIHSSEREQVATEAEREINDLKLFRFFQEELESGDLRTYDAVVVDVRNMGAFVDLPDIGAGGLIHVSDMADDFYDYDDQRNELRGRRTGRRIALGEKLPVNIVKVNESKRFLDFAPA